MVITSWERTEDSGQEAFRGIADEVLDMDDTCKNEGGEAAAISPSQCRKATRMFTNPAPDCGSFAWRLEAAVEIARLPAPLGQDL
jgi:hypothetical protein